MTLFLIIAIFVALQLGLALVQPIALIYGSLLTGAVPLTLASHESQEGIVSSYQVVNSVTGGLDLVAFRVLGLWLAACFIVLFHIGRAWKYIVLWRYHFYFLVFCGLALLWSPSLEFGSRAIAKVSAPFLFLLMVMLVVTSKRQLRVMQGLILTGALLMVMWAVWSLYTKNTFWSQLGRLTTPGNVPSIFAAHLTVALGLALVNARESKLISYWILVIVFGVSILAGITRISVAALFAAVSVMLFLSSRGLPRIILPLVGLCGVPALFFLVPAFRERMFYSGHSVELEGFIQDPSASLQYLDGSGRYAAWSHVWNEMFSSNPLFGAGIGATQALLHESNSFGIGVIHSDYLRILAETGLVGLLLFVVACCAYGTRLIRIYQSNRGSEAGNYALAGIGGLVAYLILMATDNAFDAAASFGIYVFGVIGMSEKAAELAMLEAKQPSVAMHDSPDRDWHGITTTDARMARRYPIIGGGPEEVAEKIGIKHA